MRSCFRLCKPRQQQCWLCNVATAGACMLLLCLLLCTCGCLRLRVWLGMYVILQGCPQGSMRDLCSVTWRAMCWVCGALRCSSVESGCKRTNVAGKPCVQWTWVDKRTGDGVRVSCFVSLPVSTEVALVMRHASIPNAAIHRMTVLTR